MVNLSRQRTDARVPNPPARSQPSTRPRPRLWTWWGDEREPRPPVGPFTRWPRVADSVLAAVVVSVSLIFAAASRLDEGEEFSVEHVADLPIPAYLIMAAVALSLCWRRRSPLAVTGVAIATLWLWAILDYGESPDLVMAVGLYSVGRHMPQGWRNIGIVVAGFITITVAAAQDQAQQLEPAGAFVFAILPWYIGRRVRTRGDYLSMLQDRAIQLERDRDAEARRAVADERSRIARELHDVVAHRVSMMTVQAGAAKTIARHDIDAAVNAMGDVEKAGRQALGELRHLLGVLRPDSSSSNDSSSDSLGPQPGIADIPALLAGLAQAGTNVSLTIDPHIPDDLPAAVDLSAYRIVQESLTNIVKHAGTNPNVDTHLVIKDRQLEIEITNTTSHQSRSLPGAGYGIAGMRERAHLLGGTLDAGPCPGGRFRVTALLPLDPDPT